MSRVDIKQVHDHAEYFEKYYEVDQTDRHWKQSSRPQTKADLQKAVVSIKDSDKVKDMAVRNFVRDAWKADIAIKHNAIFFTCDQNALLYHKWICGQEIVDRNAVALFLGDEAFVRV